jgi:hypothetical protein
VPEVPYWPSWGSFCIVSVEPFGASFLDPFDDDCGGVAVCPLKASSRRFLGFLGVTFFLALSSNRRLAGGYWIEEGWALEGSAGAGDICVASPKPISSMPARPLPRAEVGGCGVEMSMNDRWSPVSRPGVVLNTEYSSAKVGVQPLRFSKLELFLGVSKVGLENWAEVGVWVGVGGWAFGFPKLGVSSALKLSPGNL